MLSCKGEVKMTRITIAEQHKVWSALFAWRFENTSSARRRREAEYRVARALGMNAGDVYRNTINRHEQFETGSLR